MQNYKSFVNQKTINQKIFGNVLVEEWGAGVMGCWGEPLKKITHR